MTVYNGEAYLKETMDSILGQTFNDFVFLIMDNASEDGSCDIIKSYDDQRIQLHQLPQNIGQVAALNRGLELVKTPLTARMDADDISLPQRFEKQVTFLEQHPEIGICGTFADAFNQDNVIRWTYPCTSEEINVKLLFECAMVHPSVMMRKDLLDHYNLCYDETLNHSYDWDLWQRASQHVKLANIPLVLIRYRLHQQSESLRTSDKQEKAAQRLDDFTLGRLGLESHPLRQIHRDVAYETFKVRNRDAHFLEQVEEWFTLLETANKEHNVYDPHALNQFLKERLFVVLTNNTRLNGKVWNLFFKEKLYRNVPISWTFKILSKILFYSLPFRTQ